MILDYQNCTKPNSNSRIVLKEKNSKFIINNKAKIEFFLVEVDGCLINSSEVKKCDWIVYYSYKENVALFIELKGKKLDIAVEQLISTLFITKEKFSQYEKKCYAITSRVPRSGPKAQKIKIAFYKQTNTPLEIKNHQFEVVVE